MRIVSSILLAFLAAIFLACTGGSSTPVSSHTPAESKKIADQADDMWDIGHTVQAVNEYKLIYSDRNTTVARKETILPRIVDAEVKAGNADEAKRWIKRGLADGVNIAYTDPIVRNLFDVAKKEHEAAVAAAKERAEREEREAARKADEEYESDGLVLLRKTVSAVTNDFGITITGTVVNRRSKDLSYAQINFNLYDNTGAQVGTAVANILNLDSGGRWNFKAVGFTNTATQYRPSSLIGH